MGKDKDSNEETGLTSSMGVEDFAMDDDVDPDDLTFMQKLSTRPWLLFLTFSIFCGYGLSSIVFDWLWVSDMLSVQEALVFGPPSSEIIGMLITVATIGTIAFIFEAVNFMQKVFRGQEIIPEDIASLITLFVEEIPAITLNVLLASCREIPMSYYALVKAALAMVGGFIRSITMLFKYIQPRKRDKKRGFFPWLFRTIVLAGCVYTFIGACLVWHFTYTEPGDAQDDGGFRPPDGISKSYDTDRYFYKSGVYFSHPSFASCQGNNATWLTGRVNWIQLADLYELTDSGGEDATVSYGYNLGEYSYFHMKVPEVDRSGVVGYIETCYYTNLTNYCQTASVPIATCDTNIPNTRNQVEFLFYTTPKSKTIVFGDILVNVSYSNTSDCTFPSVDHIGNLLVNDEATSQFQYFRVRREVNDTLISNYLLEPASGNYTFFTHYNGDFEKVGYLTEEDGVLLNVTDEWKTGYNRCNMTGSLRPNPQNMVGLCGTSLGHYDERALEL